MARRRTRKSRSSRRRRSNFTKKALPAVKKGLSKIGRNVSSAAKSSAPAIKKGFGTIFNVLSRTVDAGYNKVKGLVKSRRRR